MNDLAKSTVETYGRLFEFKGEDAIRTRDLEAIPFEYDPLIETVTTITTSEWVSVCPYSGLPDFAELEIWYRPNKHLIEHKSLKLYITSFKEVGILQEHAAQRACKDLGKLLDPARLSVTMKFAARGGFVNEVYSDWVGDES